MRPPSWPPAPTWRWPTMMTCWLLTPSTAWASCWLRPARTSPTATRPCLRRPPSIPRVGHFKPDYAPEYLMAVNYICHLAVFKKELFEAVGGERPGCDWRARIMTFSSGLSNRNAAPATLPPSRCMSRRCCTTGGCMRPPPAAAPGLSPTWKRPPVRRWPTIWPATGRHGTVEPGQIPRHLPCGVGPARPRSRCVSILIPNEDRADDLEKCLHSIYAKTTYENFEVIVIENNSTDPATFDYYKRIPNGTTTPGWSSTGAGFSLSRIKQTLAANMRRASACCCSITTSRLLAATG